MPFLRAGLFVSLHHKKKEFRLKSLHCMLPEINSCFFILKKKNAAIVHLKQFQAHLKCLGPGPLSGHEDSPCYRVACSRTFLEKQVWVWILRDIKGRPPKDRNAGDHLSATEVLSIWRVLSKICGLTLISPPALCHSGWFRSGSVSAGRGIVPSTTLLDYKMKQKPGDSCLCVFLSGATSSDMDNFYIQHCRLELA